MQLPGNKQGQEMGRDGGAGVLDETGPVGGWTLDPRDLYAPSSLRLWPKAHAHFKCGT
jgi:hypothetical protein